MTTGSAQEATRALESIFDLRMNVLHAGAATAERLLSVYDRTFVIDVVGINQ